MSPANERAWIARLAAGMPRSPHQANRLHESDAELVRIPGTSVTLAITTDGVVEEIASGLYREPYLAGWMSVTVNASDLAAVGAAPLGILVSESLPADMEGDAVARLQQGIREAAITHGLPVLGGDTNVSPILQLTATAVGIVSERTVLTRRGAKPGDRLFASGPVGLGSAFAFERLMGDVTGGNTRVPFRPVARMREGQCLAGWASACMDTSDGVIATLDELMRINDVGVRLQCPWKDMLHRSAFGMSREAHLPPWTMLAGPHGEFELLFTVPRARQNAFREKTAAIGWYPIELGTVVQEAGFACRADDAWMVLDTTRIRNLFGEVGGNPRRYVTALLGLVEVDG